MEEFKTKTIKKLTEKELELEEVIKKPPTSKQLEMLKIQLREEAEESMLQKCTLLDNVSFD